MTKKKEETVEENAEKVAAENAYESHNDYDPA